MADVKTAGEPRIYDGYLYDSFRISRALYQREIDRLVISNGEGSDLFAIDKEVNVIVTPSNKNPDDALRAGNGSAYRPSKD